MNYQIDLHMHTVASTHAYSTIHDYIYYAKKKGLKLIAITDHGPDMADAPHEWHFANIRVVPRVVDEVGILRGIEANIKNITGEIDCSDRMFSQLDLVIAGFHEQVFQPQGIDTNTEALIATIKNEKVNIISHPGNPKFPIHIDEVAAAAAKHHVALEINNSSFYISRPGSEENCRKIAAAVKDAGGFLTFGSDSHIALTVGEFEHCISIVKEVGFPPERILNSNINQLITFLAIKNVSDFSPFYHL